MSARPVHGEERARRRETRVSASGAVARTDGVHERYCSGCASWTEVRGAFGLLSWHFEHDSHAGAR